MNSPSSDVVVQGAETLFAGFGSMNLCRFSEYEPGTQDTLFCKIKTVFLPISSMLSRPISIDLSSNIGAFGFR